MNGLGGLNKSPQGLVLGLVQLQLPFQFDGDPVHSYGCQQLDGPSGHVRRGDGRQHLLQVLFHLLLLLQCHHRRQSICSLCLRHVLFRRENGR